MIYHTSLPDGCGPGVGHHHSPPKYEGRYTVRPLHFSLLKLELLKSATNFIEHLCSYDRCMYNHSSETT